MELMSKVSVFDLIFEEPKDLKQFVEITSVNEQAKTQSFFSRLTFSSCSYHAKEVHRSYTQ